MSAAADWAARHRKLLIALAGFLLTWAIQQWGAGNPWVALAAGAATLAGIYQVPNRPPPPGPAHTRPYQPGSDSDD